MVLATIRSCQLRSVDGSNIEESITFIYHQEGIGRPYRRNIGIEDDSRRFVCMNPLQSSLLHNADFIEMDVTFENCCTRYHRR